MTPEASSIAPSASNDPVPATAAPSSNIGGLPPAVGSRQPSKSSPSSGSDNSSRSMSSTLSPSFESNDQSSAASSSSALTGSNSIAATDSGSTSPLSSIAKVSAITIGVAGFLLLAVLLGRVARRRRAADREKVSSNETVFSVPSPTNSTRGSSVTPSSFPAFEHRARGISSPRTGHCSDPSRTAQNLNYYRTGPVLDSELRYPAAHQQDLARTCDIAHRLDRLADQTSHNSSTMARSSASTVEIPGRRRPASLQTEAKQQPASAAPSERVYSSQRSHDDNSDLYSTEAPSEVDWTSASALSDRSYFHQSPSRASASSENWAGNSWRRQSRRFDRGTDMSIGSFLSDATDDDSIYCDFDVEL